MENILLHPYSYYDYDCFRSAAKSEDQHLSLSPCLRLAILLERRTGAAEQCTESGMQTAIFSSISESPSPLQEQGRVDMAAETSEDATKAAVPHLALVTTVTSHCLLSSTPPVFSLRHDVTLPLSDI